MEECNGWTNRATWQVNLLVKNNRLLYKSKRALEDSRPGLSHHRLKQRRRNLGWDADLVERFVRSVNPFDSDIDLDNVNFDEIAASWNRGE